MEDQRAAAESIPGGTAAGSFAEQLRTLRTAVGNPSFRKMAGRSGRISHTTLHEAAAGTRFPSWETTREFVRACEADEVQWRHRWEEARRSETVHADSPAESTGPTTVEVAPAGLVEHPKSGEGAVAGARRRRLPWFAAAAAVLVAVIAVLGVIVRGRSSPDGDRGVAAPPSPAPFSDSLIPGDASKFVADSTYPDGARVTVNEHFTKVWTLANVGKVDWHNRFLARMDPTGDDDGCQVPDRVPIGDTPPGEQVRISVPVVAPSRPGKCWVGWKMVDDKGQTYFPSRRPVYFDVTVTG